jgi:hypothetical protein
VPSARRNARSSSTMQAMRKPDRNPLWVCFPKNKPIVVTIIEPRRRNEERWAGYNVPRIQRSSRHWPARTTSTGTRWAPPHRQGRDALGQPAVPARRFARSCYALSKLRTRPARLHCAPGQGELSGVGACWRAATVPVNAPVRSLTGSRSPSCASLRIICGTPRLSRASCNIS